MWGVFLCSKNMSSHEKWELIKENWICQVYNYILHLQESSLGDRSQTVSLSSCIYSALAQRRGLCVFTVRRSVRTGILWEDRGTRKQSSRAAEHAGGWGWLVLRIWHLLARLCPMGVTVKIWDFIPVKGIIHPKITILSLFT